MDTGSDGATKSLQEQWAGYQCPKCGYRRKPTETTSIHECPGCGVIYAKARVATARDTEAAVKQPKKKEPPANSAISLCKSCKKKVARTAKTCPHCGVSDPGLTPTDSFIAAVTMVLIIGGFIYWLASGSDSGGDSARDAQYEREKTAKHLCADQAKASATYPATVDIQWFQGVFAEPYNDGITLVKMNFTAKNAFGTELPFLITCLVDHGGEVVSSRVNKR